MSALRRSILLALFLHGVFPPRGWPMEALASPPERATLRVVWVDVMGSAPFAFESMAEEAGSLLGQAGWELAWTQVEPGALWTEQELAVVLLASDAGGRSAGRSVMGATGRNGPTSVWIYLPNVARTLDLDTRRSERWSAGDRRRLGRALGRVVAHEIVHVLAPELPHARRGIMAAHVGRALLLPPGLRLDPVSRDALGASREAWRRIRWDSTAAPASLASARE